jgi:hypothetical protein
MNTENEHEFKKLSDWEECLLKLRLAVVACRNADDKMKECLDACHELNTALAKAQSNMIELREAVCIRKAYTN